MKIFVICEYDYDGYNICIYGIFTKREYAEKYKDLYKNKLLKIPIVEWEIDRNLEALELGLKGYYTRATISGKITIFEDDPHRPDSDWHEDRLVSHQAETKKYFILECCIFAKNENDAIKITEDKRRKLITENKWPADETIERK